MFHLLKRGLFNILLKRFAVLNQLNARCIHNSTVTTPGIFCCSRNENKTPIDMHCIKVAVCDQFGLSFS